MMSQRAAISFLLIIVLLQAALGQSDDFEEELQKCQNETEAFLANATGLSEAYPSNVTCTFLNETYCAVDLSGSTSDYTQQCYEEGGRISLWTSTAACNWTGNNGTDLYISISNDPVCIAINCTYDKASYDVTGRYETLLNATGLDAYCFQIESHPVEFTTLTGMCAADTLQLQASLPVVIDPYEKCNSNSCVKNYSSAAEVYYRMCRGKGGDAYRVSKRTATCQNNIGVESVVMESNVPFCISDQCDQDAIAEEGKSLNEHWQNRISRDYATCTFTYDTWEVVNASSSNDGKNDTSSSGIVLGYPVWRWTSLIGILMPLVM
jgi:hypothetical protein